MLSADTRTMLRAHKKKRRVWEETPDAELLLRWAVDVKIPRVVLVLGACAVARLVLKYVPENERRPLRAIKAAEYWAKGKVTAEHVRKRAEDVSALIATLEYRRLTPGIHACYAAAHAAYCVMFANSGHLAATWAYDANEMLKHLPACQTVREMIPWPIVASAHEKAGFLLGEPWIETVAPACGVKLSTARKLTHGARRDIEIISREMAEKGRWDSKVLEPLWKSIEIERGISSVT